MLRHDFNCQTTLHTNRVVTQYDWGIKMQQKWLFQEVGHHEESSKRKLKSQYSNIMPRVMCHVFRIGKNQKWNKYGVTNSLNPYPNINRANKFQDDPIETVMSALPILILTYNSRERDQ